MLEFLWNSALAYMYFHVCIYTNVFCYLFMKNSKKHQLLSIICTSVNYSTCENIHTSEDGEVSRLPDGPQLPHQYVPREQGVHRGGQQEDRLHL